MYPAPPVMSIRPFILSSAAQSTESFSEGPFAAGLGAPIAIRADNPERLADHASDHPLEATRKRPSGLGFDEIDLRLRQLGNSELRALVELLGMVAFLRRGKKTGYSFWPKNWNPAATRSWAS